MIESPSFAKADLHDEMEIMIGKGGEPAVFIVSPRLHELDFQPYDVPSAFEEMSNAEAGVTPILSPTIWAAGLSGVEWWDESKFD